MGAANDIANDKPRLLDIVFLAMLAAVPPLATDMYLPAMDSLQVLWHTTSSVIGLSLVLWFVAFSASLLIAGPLSDKFGRRPILLGGLTVFILASVACSLANGPTMLIAARVFQGLGAAGPSAMAMAICRDRFDGAVRKKALAYVGIMLAVMPMIAPVIGAMLLRCASWRFIFATQAALAALTVAVSFTYRESAGELVSGGLFTLLARYGRLMTNGRYMLANGVMGLLLGPFYAFIAFSPIVYQSYYRLSKEAFSVLFALNALMSMLGALLCTRIAHRFSDRTLLTVCLFGCLAGGAGLLLMGSSHWALFSAPMCVVTFFCGMSRPVSNHIVLEQVETDVGSASSFLVFYQFLVGAACMALVSVEWSAPITVFGLVALVVPLLVLTVWPLMLRKIRLPNEKT